MLVGNLRVGIGFHVYLIEFCDVMCLKMCAALDTDSHRCAKGQPILCVVLSTSVPVDVYTLKYSLLCFRDERQEEF